MKKLLTLFFVGFSLLLKAQDLPINDQTNLVTFMEVVEADKLDAQELYDILKEWGKAKNYEIVEDKEGEDVQFVGYLNVSHPGLRGGDVDEGRVKFTLLFNAKEGKYRYIITDFVHEGKGKEPSGGPLEETTPKCGKVAMSGRGWVTIKNNTKSQIEALIEDFKQKVLEVENDPANNSDW